MTGWQDTNKPTWQQTAAKKLVDPFMGEAPINREEREKEIAQALSQAWANGYKTGFARGADDTASRIQNAARGQDMGQ